MTNSYNIEAEKDILSIILNEDGAFLKYSDQLSPNLFFDPFHQKVVGKMRKNLLEDVPIEISTLSSNINEQQIIRETKLRNKSGEFFDKFFAILEECRISRTLENLGNTILEDLHKDGAEPSNVLNKTKEMLDNFGSMQTSSIYSASDFIDSLIEEHEETYRLAQEGELLLKEGVVPTNLKGLNDLLLRGGLSGGDLVIIAARPSVGKSELAINLCSHAAIDKGMKGFFYSLEMSKEDLLERVIIERSKVDSFRLQRGLVTYTDIERIKAAGKAIKGSDIIFEDNISGNIYNMLSSIRKADMKYGLDFVIIDYVQLVDAGDSGNSGNRANEVAKVTRALKRESTRMGIPFIALSQLSRAHLIENREPDLRDLRESGSIEQDADVVIFLYATGAEIKKKDIAKTKAILGKQRNGPLGEVFLENQKSIQTFVEISESEFRKGERAKVKQENFEEDDDLPF